MRCHLIASCLLLTAVGWGGETSLNEESFVELVAAAAVKAPPKNASLPCVPSARPGRLSARYTEARGIGYNHGYTTLEGFFSPIGTLRSSWMPFVDVRGHLFNNAFPAGNGGAGVRYLGKYVYGGSVYYDFRRTRHHWYNQVGVGLETLGDFWGVHLNGYIPVGKKKSHFYGQQTTVTLLFAPTLTSTGMMLMNVEETTRKRVEFDFYGVDAHAEFSLGGVKWSSFETGFGPYFFWGKYDKKFVGGRASVTQRVYDWFTASVSASYDNLFHWRVQGHVGVNIPLGPRPRRDDNCGYSKFLDRNLNFGPERFEIIPVDQTTVVTTSIFVPPPPAGAMGAFNPASLAGIWLWLDGQDPAGNGTLPGNGTLLAKWVDKSGNGNNFSDGRPPTFTTSGITGHPAVIFNGGASPATSTFLTGNTATPISSYTFFGVVQNSNTASPPQQVIYGNGSPGVNGEAFGIFNNSGPADRGDLYGGVAFLDDALSTTSPEIWSSTWNGSTTTFFVNNTQHALSNSGSAPSTPTGTSRVGTNQTANSTWRGDIGEVIFYTRNLSSTEQLMIYSYLHAKWGI